MTSIVSTFADECAVLQSLLKPYFPEVRFCTELPAKFETMLPVCRTQRVGGGDVGAGIDGPRVDIDCFETDEDSVRLFASQIRTALQQYGPGYTALGATIAEIGVHTFGWRPYANTNVRSHGMTVDLALHNQ